MPKTARRRKKKCDERHPQCNRCLEQGLRCEYLPVSRRQRSSKKRKIVHTDALPPTAATKFHSNLHDEPPLSLGPSSGHAILCRTTAAPSTTIAGNCKNSSAFQCMKIRGDTSDDLKLDVPHLDNSSASSEKLFDIKSAQTVPIEDIAQDPCEENITTTRFALNKAPTRDPQSSIEVLEGGPYGGLPNMFEENTYVSCGPFSDFGNAQQHGTEEFTLVFCPSCNSSAFNIRMSSLGNFSYIPTQLVPQLVPIGNSQMGLSALNTSPSERFPKASQT